MTELAQSLSTIIYLCSLNRPLLLHLVPVFPLELLFAQKRFLSRSPALIYVGKQAEKGKGEAKAKLVGLSAVCSC